MKKLMCKRLLFMGVKEYQDLLKVLNIAHSSRIINYLRIIKCIFFIVVLVIYLLYYFFDFELFLQSFFERRFGESVGSIVTIAFITLVVFAFFLFYEIVFLFLPKFVFIKVKIKSNGQSVNDPMINTKE